MRRFTSIGFSCTSRPHTETAPALGGMKPVIMRMVVDLPAPLGPRNPSTSPLPTAKETPSTARFGPKDLLRFSTLITAPSKNTYTDRRGLPEVPCRGRRNRILSQPRSGYKQMTNDHQPAPSSGGTKAL